MTDMMSTAAPNRPSKTRKMAMQMAIGAIVGAAATAGLLTSVGKSGFDMDDPSRVIALMVGLVSLLTGLAVGVGALAPKQGAHLLNVEDADELREQRGRLWRGALVMVLLGAALMALALTIVDGSAGIFSPEATGLIAAICFVGVAILSFAERNDQDELMRSVGREAMTLAMYGLTALFFIWGALSHIGDVEWITPLGMISALLMAQLIAIMVVAGRRGLLRPR